MGPDPSDYVGYFFTQIRSIQHTPLRVYTAGETCIAEMDCTYVDQWGRTLSVPVCNVMHLSDELIDEYFIYIDNHQLFVPPADEAAGS